MGRVEKRALDPLERLEGADMRTTIEVYRIKTREWVQIEISNERGKNRPTTGETEEGAIERGARFITGLFNSLSKGGYHEKYGDALLFTSHVNAILSADDFSKFFDITKENYHEIERQKKSQIFRIFCKKTVKPLQPLHLARRA